MTGRLIHSKLKRTPLDIKKSIDPLRYQSPITTLLQFGDIARANPGRMDSVLQDCFQAVEVQAYVVASHTSRPWLVDPTSLFFHTVPAAPHNPRSNPSLPTRKPTPLCPRGRRVRGGRSWGRLCGCLGRHSSGPSNEVGMKERFVGVGSRWVERLAKAELGFRCGFFSPLDSYYLIKKQQPPVLPRPPPLRILLGKRICEPGLVACS